MYPRTSAANKATNWHSVISCPDRRMFLRRNAANLRPILRNHGLSPPSALRLNHEILGDSLDLPAPVRIFQDRRGLRHRHFRGASRTKFIGRRRAGLCRQPRSATSGGSHRRRDIDRVPICDRHAWTAGAAGRLHAFALCQSERAERRPSRHRLPRHLRQSQPVQSQGRIDRPGAHHKCLPDLDGALAGRAFHPLWADRQDDRDRCRSQLRDLPPRPTGAILGRDADHIGGCLVFLRAPAPKGPAAAARRLRPRQTCRNAGRGNDPLRFSRPQRPRNAAHSGAHAGSLAPQLQCRDLRRGEPCHTDRIGPLSGRRGRSRPASDFAPQQGLLGERSAGGSRPL